MAKEQDTFMVEDAQIFYRNFAGKEDRFGNTGKRTFLVFLNHDVAEIMLKDGWAVKYLEAKEEGEDDVPYIPVTVKYEIKPPNVVLIVKKPDGTERRTHLDESTIEILDYADLKTVDLIANAYRWEVNGKTGTKAYLQSMYVTIEEDPLQAKYAQD